MRINNNIMALQAHGRLQANQNRGARSMERLSTGLRISRAADDAAGLAISEKMRSQVRSLGQASRNAQNGISLLQVAEGALGETHSVLHRMRELSVQAANDTLTIGDRMEIQHEVDQLIEQVDRIAHTTEYNTKKLLDGSTSALASSGNGQTRIYVRDGLRVTDQFGTEASGGGNYKIALQATPGKGQVQKTDIMRTTESQTQSAQLRAEDDGFVLDRQAAVGGTFSLGFPSTEKQQLDLGGASAGSFILRNERAAVQLDAVATVQEIRIALESMFGEGKVDIEELMDGTMVLSFFDQDEPSGLTIDGSGLIGGSGASLDTTITTGSGVEDITDIRYGGGGITTTGSAPDFSMEISEYAGFDWTSVNTNQPATIGITKTDEGLRVDIAATGATGDSIAVTDEYAMIDETGTYRYQAHGIAFAIPADQVNAMNTGDGVEIDLAEAFGSGADLDILDLSDGTIAIGSGWDVNVNATDGGVSTAKLANDTIYLDGEALPPGVESLRIEGSNLTDNTGSAEIVVTLFGADNSELSRDAYTFSTSQAEQTFRYDNHGVRFDLEIGDAQTLVFTTDVSYDEQVVGTYDYHLATTSPLAYDASWTAIQQALEELPTVGTGNVEVDATRGYIRFMGDASRNTLSFDGSNLVMRSSHIAGLDTSLAAVDRFWDGSGNFLLDEPQTITIVQGDGRQAALTLDAADTMQSVQDKLNAAIGGPASASKGMVEAGKGLGQGAMVDAEDTANFATYVTEEMAADSGFTSVAGTFVIQSAIAGRNGELTFLGEEAVINALSLNTVQHAEENRFTVNVTDAHDGRVITENRRGLGHLLVGVVHANVDVEVDGMTNVDVTWDSNSHSWALHAQATASHTFVHLADNSMVFHIGANERQDVSASIGDMTAGALGVENLQVTRRDLANHAILRIDS